MVVSEIGLLRLKDASMLADPSLHSSLSEIRGWLEDFTGHVFHYLNGVEDSREIYLFGEWDSLEQHYRDMHGNEKWKQTVVDMSKRFFEFQWMCHYDFAMGNVRLDGEGEVVMSIGRHFVEGGKRGDVQMFFEGNRRYLDEYVTEGKAVGGWRVDKGNSAKGSKLDEQKDREEFVLLVPWKDVQQHHGFAETEGFKEYSKLKDLIVELDLKHAKLLKGW